jgi:hypothetical protein
VAPDLVATGRCGHLDHHVAHLPSWAVSFGVKILDIKLDVKRLDVERNPE